MGALSSNDNNNNVDDDDAAAPAYEYFITKFPPDQATTTADEDECQDHTPPFVPHQQFREKLHNSTSNGFGDPKCGGNCLCGFDCITWRQRESLESMCVRFN